MARIIRKAASMNAVLILQANEAVDNLPAKTLDLHRLMRDNGYPRSRSTPPRVLPVRCSWATRSSPPSTATARIGAGI